MAVVGDRTYGGGLSAARRRAIGDDAVAALTALDRHALDAFLIGFTHPGSGEMHRYTHGFVSDLKDLVSLLDRV